jgi:hypothetical protein
MLLVLVAAACFRGFYKHSKWVTSVELIAIAFSL